MGLLSWHSLVKNSLASAGDMGWTLSSGKISWRRVAKPLQYSCLKNPTEGGAWYIRVHRVAQSWSDGSNLAHFHQRHQRSSVQSLSRVRLFVTSWTAARQASLSITNFPELTQLKLKLMSIESVMPSNHLILCCPLLFPPLIFPSIRVIRVNESVLHVRWPKYWSFSFSISPSNE